MSHEMITDNKIVVKKYKCFDSSGIMALKEFGK